MIKELTENFWESTWHYPIIFIAIIVLTFITGKLVKILLEKFFKRSAHLINIDLSKYNILKHLLVNAIYVVGLGIAVYSIPALRSLSLSIFAGAGIMAAIIGFASQKAFSNIISGIFIAIFKPFRVEDRIQVGTNFGVVEDITLRHTVIRNFENKRIMIPNAVISDDTVTNFTIIDERICKVLNFGISYGSDIKKARAIIQEEATKHPLFIDNRGQKEHGKNEDPVMVRVTDWLDSAVNLRAWVWTKDQVDAFELGCDLYESVKYRFDEEGIEIPFPHRTVFMRSE